MVGHCSFCCGRGRSVIRMSSETDTSSSSSGDQILFLPGDIVEQRWEIVRKLGEGAFGTVHEVLDTQGKVCGSMALKVESVEAKDQVLTLEIAILRSLQGTEHVCRIYAHGRNDTFTYMLMSLLGPSLSVLRRKQEKQRFSLATTTYVAVQCLRAIEDMHLAGWVHRDIKPSNFAIGSRENHRRIFIFDFGLARRYTSSPNSAGVRQPRRKVGFRGTTRYCSVNNHRGKELGRHDDLISLLYSIVEMFKGSLPWKNLDRNKEVLESKTQLGHTIYSQMPARLTAVHEYAHSLRFGDKPDYNKLRDVLHEVIVQNRFHYNHVTLDWDDNTQPQ